MHENPTVNSSRETELTMEEIGDKLINLELSEYATQEGSSRHSNNTNSCVDVKVTNLLPVLPSRDIVPVKKNAATILREAYKVTNEEEKEIKRLYQLVSGGMDFKHYEMLEEKEREMAKTTELQEIQRKHLLGLLSREEAIIAKHKLHQTNKAKKDQIDREKREARKIIEKITRQHTQRTKNIIKDTQQIQKNIKQKKKGLMDKNKKVAHEVADINKQLYQKYVLQKEQELEEKILIIKQIKELSTIKDNNGNRFDPTETMNLGLLCEMSLNELRERLRLDKVYLKEQIENRKNCITKQKQKQQQFLMDTQRFIEDCRSQRKKINILDAQTRPTRNKVEECQDVIQLREKLLATRRKRLQLECAKS